MNLHAYIQFGGKCAEAFAYYEEQLGATNKVLMPFAGSPGAEMAPPEWRDKIMHGSLSIGPATVMGSDGMPGGGSGGMQNCSLALSLDSPEQARRVFDALADGGQVGMPLAPSFFAEAFGMVVDRFGVSWMIICEGARAQG